ncbi:hypothetical protein [Nonomuraea sp. NPDC050783]|uniref:hypothetical protein n=1 Tax=Nonomuraea sp. NPDC050783 TaxID=3154634 RepID=UPI003466924A
MSTLIALPEPIGLSSREQVRGRAALLATWLLLARHRSHPDRLATHLAARARDLHPATAQQAPPRPGRHHHAQPALRQRPRLPAALHRHRAGLPDAV